MVVPAPVVDSDVRISARGDLLLEQLVLILVSLLEIEDLRWGKR